MTTNLHDKMLAAIDAYFSASDGTEAEVAENLLLDVRDEINKQKYVPETNFGNMAEPKIGCVNHDCDKCKAVQEPFGYLEIDDIESQREYPHNCRNVNLWHEGGEGMTAIYIAPPAAQPAPVQEPVKFLANGTRFKTSEFPYGVCINGLPKELSGCWVALVAAEDDCHLKLTAPPAAQPAPVQEPIYQMQMMDGKWIDQAKQSYEYNKAHGHTVRIVYTTPPAQPAPVQEPVAIVVAAEYEDGSTAGHRLEWRGRNEANDFPEGTEFYTAPQPVPVKTYHDGKPWPVAPKPWVGLTKEDREFIELTGGKSDVLLAELVESKLKEKNT